MNSIAEHIRFLVNKKIALVMVAGKWMQEFSNCKK